MEPAAFLTDRQQQVLSFLAAHLRDTGHPATVREAAVAFHVSHVTLYEHCLTLEAKGHLKRVRGPKRGHQFIPTASVCCACGRSL